MAEEADAVGADYITPGLQRWRRVTDGPLLILAIGTLPLLLLETVRQTLTRGDQLFLDIVNLVVLVAFAIDYAVELRLARPRATYVRREWSSLLIVAAQAVALVPALSGIAGLRALRGVRLARSLAVTARLFAIGGAAAAEGRPVVRRHAAGSPSVSPDSRG